MALKIGDVRAALRLNTNWLLASVLGLDVLTDAEKKELEQKNRLPKKSLKLVEKSFILGRLKSTLTSSEYGKIDYDELVSKSREANLSPLEKKAIEHIKSKAVADFKNFSNKVENEVLNQVQAADSKVMAQAANHVGEDLDLGKLEELAYTELLNSLEKSINDVYENGWNLSVETGFHAAKTQGIAQSILNGLDVYAGRGGPDSRVSVIPKPTACEDCKIQYLDNVGNPKIFILRELISNGSNADSVHSKTKGVHTFWKPTLPPLHPRCRCDLQYIPDGAMWLNGKLTMPGGLSKAIGDSPLSATRKPQGAPANAAAPANMNPPTMKGTISPLQGSENAGTAAPSGGASAGTQKPGGKKDDTVPCPYGGGDACVEAGGHPPGSETHKAGGAIMQAHMAYQAKNRQGSSDMADSMSDTAKQVEDSQAAAHPHAEDLKNLSKGEITESRPLSGNEKGATVAYKVKIEGLGDAIVKPPAYSDKPLVEDGTWAASGAHTSPPGTGHTREKAFYQGTMMFGLTDHVPPTEVRTFEGKTVSAQKWMDGFSPAGTTTTIAGGGSNIAKGILDSCVEDKRDKLHNKLNETIVMGALFNHNDQHTDNLLISDDFSDVRMIDNSASFGTGMEGFCCQLFAHMHKAGYSVKIPDYLMKKFSNTTLSDVRRGLGNTVEDWAVGQSYMRMKYLHFLQEREGSLDYEKFRGATYGNGDGTMVSPHPGYWDDIQYKKGPNGAVLRDTKGGMIPEKTDRGELISPEYNRRLANGTTSNQLFESFAKQWISDAKKLPEGHPDRISAEELDKIGIFMGRGFAVNPSGYRAEGSHREYEKSIKPGYPPVDVKKASSSESTVDAFAPTMSSQQDTKTVGGKGKKKEQAIKKLEEGLTEMMDSNDNLSEEKKAHMARTVNDKINKLAITKSLDKLRLYVTK